MKKIVLKKLTLKNFRGIKELEVNFNDVATNISGENGTGKSTIFNAFCWLLFGKDKEERKDFNIRPIIEGELLRKVDCEVSATLLVGSNNVEIRRVFKEKWVKPRGQTEEVFSGNETECFWNDSPISVTEYQKRINDIVNESLFKMITNPLFFSKMKWQDQREQLFQIAGTITDVDIAAKKPEFSLLLDKISGKSMADFKREIGAKKRRLKDELEQVQPRIDQTYRLMPELSNFDLIESEVKEYQNKIEAIDRAIADKNEAAKHQQAIIADKLDQINELKNQQRKILYDARAAHGNAVFNANQKHYEIVNNIQSLKTTINRLTADLNTIVITIEKTESNVELKLKELEKLRQNWQSVNESEYTSSDLCSCCNQELPSVMKADARKLFSEAKAAKIASITDSGNVINNEIKALEKQSEDLDDKRKEIENSIVEQNDKLEILKIQILDAPPILAQELDANDVPEYVKLSKEIDKLESTINEIPRADTEELQESKKSIQNEIDIRKNILLNKSLIAKYTAEIKALEERGKELSQLIADIEREEFVIQQFNKVKIDECELRINSLFTFVNFKLFEYTIDGNEIETCIPLVAGVPFGAANTAGQINAGIDIINALTEFYDISAPIFIDGRESINDIAYTDSQIINLVVSKEKLLTIK